MQEFPIGARGDNVQARLEQPVPWAMRLDKRILECADMSALSKRRHVAALLKSKTAGLIMSPAAVNLF